MVFSDMLWYEILPTATVACYGDERGGVSLVCFIAEVTWTSDPNHGSDKID